jgi:hypothetical protein
MFWVLYTHMYTQYTHVNTHFFFVFSLCARTDAIFQHTYFVCVCVCVCVYFEACADESHLGNFSGRRDRYH